MMRKTAIALLLIILCQPCGLRLSRDASAQVTSKKTPARKIYYPPRGDAWQRRRPEEVGMDGALLDAAVAYAKTQESKVPRDFSTQVETFGRPCDRLALAR